MRVTFHTGSFARRQGLAMVLASGSAQAVAGMDFADKIERVLREYQLIQSVAADMAYAQEQITLEQSAYYSTLTIKGGAGHRQAACEEGFSGRAEPMHDSIEQNQLITDFAVSDSRGSAARALLSKAAAERDVQRQDLLLAAIEAHLHIIQAQRTYTFALQSERNIKAQNVLENTRFAVSPSDANDVLQVQAQWAAAQARRVLADVRLREAQNRYQVIFGEGLPALERLQVLNVPRVLMPPSEQILLERLRAQSPDFLAASLRAQGIQAQHEVACKNELMPRLALQLSRAQQDACKAYSECRQHTQAAVNFAWQFDFGMRARAAEQALAGAQEQVDYLSLQAIEQARNAWLSWQASRERVQHLRQYIKITEQFLTLARSEHETRRRSLLGLLNAEANWVNAQSDVNAAATDEVIAAYRVLRVLGQLDQYIFRQPGIVLPAEQDILATLSSASSVQE